MPAALLIGGLLFFGALVLVALNQTLIIWSRSQTEGQATFWQTILGAITGKAYVTAITRAVRGPVSRWALAQLAPVTRWFVALNSVVTAHSSAVAAAEEATADAIERLRHSVIPRAAGKAVAPVKATATRAAHKATAATSQATATSHALTRYQVRTDKRVAHATVAVDVTLPKAIGRINTEVDRLSRDQTKLRERTTRLENGAVRTFEWLRSHPFSAVTGVFAGAVAVALARLGFGFLRCRAWKDLGRSLTCGMGAWLSRLLELVAVFALSLLGVLDPEALATVTVRAVDVVEPQLEAILRETGTLERDVERFAALLGI